jgi:hypothetical protein
MVQLKDLRRRVAARSVLLDCLVTAVGRHRSEAIELTSDAKEGTPSSELGSRNREARIEIVETAGLWSPNGDREFFRLTFEIYAKIPPAAPDNVIRTVTQYCWTLESEKQDSRSNSEGENRRT